MNRFTVLTAVACATVCPLASCLSPKEPPDQGTCEPKPGERGRWAHDEQLHGIMVEMEREVLNYWPQEIEDEFGLPTTRSRRAACALEESCWLADGLSAAVAKIPEAVRRLDMPEDDRGTFLAQAQRLQDHTDALVSACENADPEEMHRVLRSIKNTCRSCHQTFRTLSGPVRRGDSSQSRSNPRVSGAPS